MIPVRRNLKAFYFGEGVVDHHKFTILNKSLFELNQMSTENSLLPNSVRKNDLKSVYTKCI